MEALFVVLSILPIVLAVFVLSLLLRVTRALERIAESMSQRPSGPDGGQKITT